MVSHSTVGPIEWWVEKDPPLWMRDAPEQAEFWIRESNRVANMNPNEADIMMGAALVLDCPAEGFKDKYLMTMSGLSAQEGIERAEAAFESKCRQQCLEFAANATQLEPNNVEWWRLRALLLRWRRTPRTRRLIDVLHECAEHDPDNALYDYLAAEHWWFASTQVNFFPSRLIVKDRVRFLEGVACFERAQTKKHFTMGDAGFSTVIAFLRHTQLAPGDQEKIVNSRYILWRRDTLLGSLSIIQQFRADAAAAMGNVRQSLILRRQDIALIEQFRSGHDTKADDVALEQKQMAIASLTRFRNICRDRLTPDELAEINALERNALIEDRAIELALNEFATSNSARLPSAGPLGIPVFSPNPPTRDQAVSVLVIRVLVSVFYSLLLFWIAAVFLGRLLILIAPRFPNFGIGGQVMALVLAIVVTVVVFGLAPAEIIARSVQEWVMTLLVILSLAGVFLWAARRCFAGRKLRFSLGGMFVVISVLCIVCAIVSVAKTETTAFDSFPFKLSVPAVREPIGGWEEGLESVGSDEPYGIWLGALFQWAAYDGGRLTLCIWIVLLALLFFLKARWARQRVDASAFRARDYLATFFRTVGRSSALLCSVVLIGYLCIAANLVRTVEDEFQRNMVFARDPDAYWTSVNEAIERLESDEVRMAGIGASVDEERALLSNNQRHGG